MQGFSCLRRSTRRLLALSLAGVLGGCASLGRVLEPPEVSVVNLTPEAASGFEQRFQVELRIANPNERALEVTGLRFELDVNGERLARGQTGESVTVPRLGDATLTVPATTTVMDVLRQVLAMPNATGVTYRVRGRVFLAGFFPPSIDFDREDELVRLPASPPPAKP